MKIAFQAVATILESLVPSFKYQTLSRIIFQKYHVLNHLTQREKLFLLNTMDSPIS